MAIVTWMFNWTFPATELVRGLALHAGAHHLVRLAINLLSHELDSPVLGIVTLLYVALLAWDFVFSKQT